MIRNNIYDLIPEHRGIYGIYDDAYADKYIHDVPDTITCQRESFIKALCKSKVILHIGSNGVFNPALEEVAKKVYAIDKDESDNKASNFTKMDIEVNNCFKDYPKDDIELVIAGDILEHLSNPGSFLNNLKSFNCEIFISVPNAFGKSHLDWLVKNKENVHKDHVAYYSYNTLKCLVERHGYKIRKWLWYNGQPRIAEGIMFILQKKPLSEKGGV